MKTEKQCKGFTLVEVTAAAVILVIITASVMTVINRCIESTIDNELKLKAFKVARDNMEFLLGETSVSEIIEFGSLEEYPDIEWEITVKASADTPENDWWLKAISVASYTAASGEREEIELVHWLTDLTEAQVNKIKEQRELELDFLDEELINPYGDDPEGLMMFQEGLASDGKYIQAAKIALDLIKKYPNSQESLDAAEDARLYARKSTSYGDYGIAADIVIEIATQIDEPTITNQCVDDALKYSRQAAQSGQFYEAAEIAKRIAEELPDNKKAKTALGLIYPFAQAAIAKGDPRSANAIVEGMKDTHPEIQAPESIPENLPEQAANAPEDPTKRLPDNNTPDNANKPEWMRRLEAGEISVAEAFQIALEERDKR